MKEKLEKNSLENQLFDWEEWGEFDIMAIMFHNITLNKNISKFKKGTKFKWATIDFRDSLLQMSNDKEIYEFKLKLDIEEEADE